MNAVSKKKMHLFPKSQEALLHILELKGRHLKVLQALGHEVLCKKIHFVEIPFLYYLEHIASHI